MVTFLRNNQQLCSLCTMRNQQALVVSILSWEGLNLLASSVVAGALYSNHQNPRQWAANEAIVVLSVCTCIATHLMMDLNQKLIKSMPREDTCCSMFTIRQKCLCKKLGVKKWEGICLKGTYFQGFTVSMYQLIICGTNCIQKLHN